MKKILTVMFGILLAIPAVKSQTIQRWTETFDSTVSFNATPAGSWIPNSMYYAPNSAGANPKSYFGMVPNTLGATIILETKQPYDFSTKDYIILRFSHICKVSPRDTVLIQYRERGTAVWKTLPAISYTGKASNYALQGFNAASYPEWQSDDSTALPQQSWWKEESFDLSVDLQRGYFDLRFVIKRGQVQGTQISYGWLIDNLQIMAANYPLRLPTVECISPLIKDTIYGTGPWEINARVKSNTYAPIKAPYLKYTATQNGILLKSDSISMTNVKKDSLWKADIPKFPAGSEVTYSIIGQDTLGNRDTATYTYIITFGTSRSVIVGNGTTVTAWTPISMYSSSYLYGWTRLLYLGHELETSRSGGKITHFAFYAEPSTATVATTIPNQECYFSLTDDTIIRTGYIDPSVSTNGLTKVWSGGLYVPQGGGWCEITLDQPFYVPPGKTLMLHWHFRHGVILSPRFYQHNTPSNRLCDASEASFTAAAARAGTASNTRPNAHFKFEGVEINNSASVVAIDIKDTVMVKSGVRLPVFATIENKGKADLTSLTIYCSVNGATAQQYAWKDNLAWDFSDSDSIGNYIPKVNGWDTITVWISNPNGVTDSTTTDDTITKYVFGSSDIYLSFVDYPANVVNNTGPFPISARITTISGAAIGAVSLKVDTSSGGTPASYILPMTFDVKASLYRTTIPPAIFGSNVTYSISLTDTLRNKVKIEKSFEIKRAAAGNPNSVALISINTPEAGGAKSGDLIPVHVTIRNKGMNDLDSCIIAWTLNGTAKKTVTYYNRNGLPDDFIDTITIDYYQPTLGQYDTLDINVSMPNGKVDSVSNDDSLQVIVLGCTGDLAGERIVAASGGDYPSMTDALTAIRNCGLAGDLTLKLKGIFTENVTINDFMPYLKGYHLTITSWNNNADSAVIQPSTGVGITLKSIKNITIQKITVNTVTATSTAIQFTDACSNIVIRDCKILTNIATSKAIAPIYKGITTGIADSIFIINNLLDGGYYGVLFYGGTGYSAGQYATNIVMDSNIITNQYVHGLYIYYTDFTDCSYNTISSRTVNTYLDEWKGINMNYVNGPVIGNRIKQKSKAIAYPCGLSLLYHNYYPSKTQNRGLVANNEIILLVTYDNGIYISTSRTEIINNSIYISGTVTSRGIYIVNTANNDIVIKNNNIVITSPSGHPIYFGSTGNLNLYDIDYNNYDAPTNIGYYGSSITSMAAWQAQIPSDVNSVKVSSAFIDPAENLDLSASETGLFCPMYPNITQDINGKKRTGQSTIGAYQIIPDELDLVLDKFTSWNTEVVENQTVSIDVNVRNLGRDIIQKAVFGWSINGQLQTPFTWTPTTPLSFLGQEIVTVGSMTINAANIYDIVVWVDNVNDREDMRHSNDTINASATKMLMAEWIAPFVDDTVYTLSFTVNALIRSTTGAPISTPTLMITTTVNGQYVLCDSIVLTKNGSTWTATLPKQYYNSKVVYSLTVADSIGGIITIMDSTYIKFEGFGVNNPSLVIGTGTGSTSSSPYSISNSFSYSRNYYMDYEISPQKVGGYIRSIGFYNTSSGTSNCDNITFYLKAVSDSLATVRSHVDPLADGATQVWGSATSTVQLGWNTFVLHAPFYLPPGKNLLLYCDNQDGSSANNGTTPYWRYTTVATGRVIYASGSPWPHTSGNLSASRPNLQLDIYGSSPYQGYDLAITSLLSPINDPNVICSDDYSPVQLVLTNMGSNDYDFTQNSISLGYEIKNREGHLYTGQITIDTGKLLSTVNDTIEIMSALPVMYSGIYNIKVWVTSLVDNIVYDDTLLYIYTSNKIGLPLDENFSNGTTVLTQFVSTAVVGENFWDHHLPDASDSVQPGQGNGTGILRFNGSTGHMSTFRTRQLDLYGSVRPQLDFWYYHDASLPETDNSYTDVNVIVGGVSHNLLTLYKRDTVTGWKHYKGISLNQYTGSSQCLLIQFESMNKHAGVQYIDRIIITSEQNLEVSEIIISPEVSLCDLKNKNLSVVLTSVTNQNIDFSSITDSLIVEVSGSPAFVIPLKNGIQGLSSDTIPIGTIDITAGTTTTVKAYLMYPVDGSLSDDTAMRVIDIHPELSIEIHSFTKDKDCFVIGTPVQQEIVLQNTGNVALESIMFELIITAGSDYSDTVRETGTIDLPTGSDTVYRFKSSYTVPASEEGLYQIRAKAYLKCNQNLIAANDVKSECVDMHNLSIIDIDNPPVNRIDKVNTTDSITISVENTDKKDPFETVSITAQIEDKHGQILNTLTGSIAKIEPFSTVKYTFTQRYTVPNDSIYFIRVYLTKTDYYPEKDTLIISRQTDFNQIGIMSIGEMNTFGLSQNIPNPAMSNTRIDYTVPEAGELVFYVRSISGQVLYSTIIKAERGVHSLELNTGTFSSGVYFYSMEYKGQRLVKQLIISH